MICFFVSDNSAFSEVERNIDGGFRIFNQFAVFVYSQSQSILPDSALGSISNWESYLSIDLDQPGFPFKISSDFILNEDFHNLVLASKLPRPGKFVDQSIAFCKVFCKLLLEHEIVKSDLIKGLSSFDPSVMIEGAEEHYSVAIEKLSGYFSNAGWISASDKVRITSQYRSFVTKLRVQPIPEYDDWIHFLSTHYEIRCRPELFQLFKYSCLCLPPLVKVPPAFIVPVWDLESNTESFQSCLWSLQSSYLTVPHLSSLYRDVKSIPRVFRLLGRGVFIYLLTKIFPSVTFLKEVGLVGQICWGNLSRDIGRLFSVRRDLP